MPMSFNLVETGQKLGLTIEEIDKIVEILGREPNFTELSIYSVMWSEHCSYKNSILQLKTLPRDGEQLLVSAGEENAGLVDIGQGFGCAFKIESHNHPSAIEPYQGAATGVGGIHRDIFTMGARPIAALNSLRFGSLDDDRTQHLVKGVVAGIGDYGNCLGVPTIGGEAYFHPCYLQNILVNAMSIGIVKAGETASAIADGPGNPVFIVGSATGKDGIHGATFASADLTEDSADDLPAVQVGDPFQEKLLLEASLEALKTNAIVGMQDMGAAGITCSTSEMSAKSETGMRIDLDKVPTRQANMKPFEILLSESQERMLVVVKKGEEAALQEVYDKWDLECAQIGEVTDSGRLEFYSNNEKVADVPAETLVLGGGAPVYVREAKVPEYFKKIESFDADKISQPKDLVSVAKRLAASPTIASKKWIFEQYDSMVRTNTLSTNRHTEASLIRIKELNIDIAASTDCNSSYVFANPYKGAMIAVCEAARNVSCTGAKPLAITNCLNFGNPYNPEVYFQFKEAIRGMGEACRKFNTPVTGGNVSFYNQSNIEGNIVPIYPTPTIGMIGLMDGDTDAMTTDFKNVGDELFLLGSMSDEIGSSEYLRLIHGEEHSPCPDINLDFEFNLQELIRRLVATKSVNSIHDTSEGGLFICLLESALQGNKGFRIDLPQNLRPDGALFGESQSRVVVSVNPSNVETLKTMCQESGIPITSLGNITDDSSILINDDSFGELNEYRKLYNESLESKLNN
jgi:phosphoribosylformylglycinamidine synthase